MKKFIVYLKNNESRVYLKDEVTSQIKDEMKKNGFRKHNVEVDADNEKDALVKIREFDNGYFESLKGMTGSAVICAIIFILMALVYYFRT